MIGGIWNVLFSTYCQTLDSGRRLLDPLGQGTRKRIAVLADNVSRHYPFRFSAGGLHQQSGTLSWRQNFILESFHASFSSKDSSQRCLEIKATAAAARHTIKHTHICCGAAPRHTHKQRENRLQRKIRFQLI